MAKKIAEMTAAGTGATIGAHGGPYKQKVEKLPVEKKQMDEMLRRNPDLKEKHVAAFVANSNFFMREDLRLESIINDYDGMANVIRENLTRIAVRQSLHEVVRKKDGKYVLYAPNTGKKHKPKAVAIFATKLAAKRAELARFPPKDPEKLERLRKQVEKLLNDPKARAREELKKESYDRDLMERAIIAHILCRDIERTMLEGKMLNEGKSDADEYQAFVNQFSQKALQGDKGYRGVRNEYRRAAAGALGRKIKEIEAELGMKIESDEPKNHTDGKTRVMIRIMGDCPVPVSFVADGKKVKSERLKETEAALTKCSEPVADKIRSRIFAVNEEDVGDDPELAQANDSMVGRTKKIFKFVDDFLAKLSPMALTILKRLLAKKYRKVGGES